MKKVLSFIIISLSFLMVQAQQLGEYRLKIGDFTELKVLDGINIDYSSSTDSAGYAVFTCDPSIASSFIFDRNNTKLTVRLTAENPPQGPLPTVTLHSKYLIKAVNNSDSTLRVLSVTNGPKFEAVVEGNGTLVLRDIQANEVKLNLRLGHGQIVASGVCDKLNVKFVGTGVIQADDLRAQNVSINCSGTGSVGVWGVEKLSIFGMGSTSVYYKGHPEIKNRSVGPKLNPLAE